MPFDEVQYNKPVTAGDVGVVAYVVQGALASLAAGLERVAAVAGTNVEEEVSSIREDAARLMTLFDETTGWKPE